ncbi:MAG: PfkB family carbohydrate kinase [Termitinemataceae bacterium]
MMGTTFDLVGIGNALIDVIDLSDPEDQGQLGCPLAQRTQTGLSAQSSSRALQTHDSPIARHVPISELSAVLKEYPRAVRCAGGGAANTVKLAAQLAPTLYGTFWQRLFPLKSLHEHFTLTAGLHTDSLLDLSPRKRGCLSTAFIGSIGNDDHGQLFKRELERAGVQTFLHISDKATGICLIHPKGILASPEAALDLKAEHIPEEVIKGARIVFIDGYILNRTDVVQHILTQAEAWGTLIAIDAGSVAMVRGQAEQLTAWCTSKPLILFLNEAEAHEFCLYLEPSLRTKNPADLDDLEVFFPLQGLTKRDIFPIIVVKLGDRGALVFAKGDIYTERTKAAVPFDSTGAGDAFAAGFLTAWLQNRSLSEAAALGNRLAREIIRVPGTRIASRVLRRLRDS